MLISRDKAVHGGQKCYYRGDRCDYRVDGSAEGAGRRYAEDEVAYDPAADGRYDAQYHNAENIHVLFQPRHSARDGECDGADNFENENKNIHRPLRNKKEYTIRNNGVLCLFT